MFSVEAKGEKDGRKVRIGRYKSDIGNYEWRFKCKA